MLEEEIDLRPYIAALLKNKYLLLFSIILSGIGGYFFATSLPSSYETASIIAFIQLDDLVQFNNAISSQPSSQPLSAIPDLAMSNEVLVLLAEELGQNDPDSVAVLRAKVNASLGGDKTILSLTVEDRSPEEAARIANTWANVFVDWANSLFLGQGGDQVRYYEEQLIYADQLLAEKTTEWLEFQQLDQTSVISSTLAFSIDTRIDYLRQVQEIDNLMLDINVYRITVDALPVDRPVPVTDQLTFFQLQSRAFQGFDSLPLIVQISGETTTTDITPPEQVVRIEALLGALEQQKELIDGEVTKLSPEILTLQQQKEVLEAQSFQLENELNVARDAIRSLAYQVEEERLTSENLTRGFRIASRADVPVSPSGPNRLLITAVIIVLVASIALFYIIARTWYQLNSNSFVSSTQIEKDDYVGENQ